MTWNSHDAQTSWAQWVAEDASRSTGYVERIRGMAASGQDLAGEARFVNALVDPASRILDAGCGPGRIAAALDQMGHEVVGVDLDPILIEAARTDYPHIAFTVGDLKDLSRESFTPEHTPFDAVVCAGNVLPFMESRTQRPGLQALATCTREGGRLAVGFQTHRGYSRQMLLDDASATGWRADALFSTWQMHPEAHDPGFLVGLFTRAGTRA